MWNNGRIKMGFSYNVPIVDEEEMVRKMETG